MSDKKKDSYKFTNFLRAYQKVPVVEYPNNVLEALPKPLVSCRISTYQHAPYIKQCIDSVLEQDFQSGFEIIIGEDGSTDGTREICIDYAQRYPSKIRLFLHNRENNIHIDGRPTAFFQSNYSRLVCRGKYIASCEGDDFWNEKNKLRIQYNHIELHDNVSMCAHNTNLLSGKYIQDKKYYPLDENYIFKLGEAVGSSPCHFSSYMIVNEKSTGSQILNYCLEHPIINNDLFTWWALSCEGRILYINQSLSTKRITSSGIYTKYYSIKDGYATQINYKIHTSKVFLKGAKGLQSSNVYKYLIRQNRVGLRYAMEGGNIKHYINYLSALWFNITKYCITILTQIAKKLGCSTGK